MMLRMGRLAIELPEPKGSSPNSAAAVQELLGGRFGEMSTLMNYTYQSFNFRGRDKLRPFYDLIANIAAEEFGHIELVSYTNH
jgi:Mn-containing catalase